MEAAMKRQLFKTAGKVLLGAGVFTAGMYVFSIHPSSRRRWADRYRDRMFAHRGFYRNDSEAPENSFAAFRKAVEKGFGIELDVQLSKDGVPVVFHDDTLERAARDEKGEAVTGRVYDYSFAELQKFHLFDSGEKIPSFEAVLKLVGGRVPLIVEIKADSEKRAIKVCEKADPLLQEYPGEYVVESFHPSAVRWYRKHRPQVIRGQLSEAYTKDRIQRDLRHFMGEHLMFNAVTQPDFIAYNSKHERNFSRRLIRRLFHCPSVAWTIESPAELKQMQGKYDLFIFEGFDPEEPETAV